jgi:hypothetical protein
MLRCCWRARIQAGSLCYAGAGALGDRREAYATLLLARSETGWKPMLCYAAGRRDDAKCRISILLVFLGEQANAAPERLPIVN